MVLVREDMPYRDCVGIMVGNFENRIWVGRRLTDSSIIPEILLHPWQMPQGGIDSGEDAEIAACRELREETGIHSVRLLGVAPGWFHYDLPDSLLGVALKGKYRGQRQKWFAFRFEGSDDEISIIPPSGVDDAEFDDWRWVDASLLPELVVSFKRRVYGDVVRSLLPFFERDESVGGLGDIVQGK